MRRTLRNLDVTRKRVLVRADLNVPIDARGAIGDESRLRAVLPTLAYLREAGAITLLCSHLGRPEGRRDARFSLAPVARRLSELAGCPVSFVGDCAGEEPRIASARAQPGDVLLLENVRFYAEEEKNDPAFAANLARLADVFVNDAFGTAHRAHASTVGVAAYIPAAAGLLMEREIAALSSVLHNPARPLVGIVGGAKISTKIDIVRNLIGVVDTLCIGGAMAFTLIAARGGQVGRSLVEPAAYDVARQILAEAGSRLALPTDAVAAASIDSGETRIVPAAGIPEGLAGYDVGPGTVEAWSPAIASARTIVWNGPLGAYERPPYAAGTRAVAERVAASGARSIVGGGDLVAALETAGLTDRMTHVSTGGGASLEFLEGKTLPGIAALEA